MKKFVITIVTLIVASPLWAAQSINESLVCTGVLSGVDLKQSWQTKDYPVQLSLKKQGSKSYILDYAGPADSFRNTEQGFTYQVDSKLVKFQAFTTGAHLSLNLQDSSNINKFVITAKKNTITKEITASVDYADSKAIRLTGDLSCE